MVIGLFVVTISPLIATAIKKATTLSRDAINTGLMKALAISENFKTTPIG
jgi:hypothetical protein